MAYTELASLFKVGTSIEHWRALALHYALCCCSKDTMACNWICSQQMKRRIKIVENKTKNILSLYGWNVKNCLRRNWSRDLELSHNHVTKLGNAKNFSPWNWLILKLNDFEIAKAAGQATYVQEKISFAEWNWLKNSFALIITQTIK